LKRKFILLFSILLILIGISISAYPWLKSWYYNYQSSKAILQWLNTTSESLSPQPSASQPSTLSNASGSTPVDSNPSADTKATANTKLPAEGLTIQENINPIYDIAYVTGNMEGILNIDSIDLHSPIFYGDTAKNLDLGICRIFGSVNAGDKGNYILAGHFSKVWGRHFNRLKEVPINDKLIIQTADNVYTYIVTETFSIKAYDASVLKDDFSLSEITLITCDYAQNPIGRYIVRGVLVR